MKDLIERLEAATGPDRELDALIRAYVYGGEARISPYNGEWCIYQPGTSKLVQRPHSLPHSIWIKHDFTHSVDAALTLVPEGLDWGIGVMGGRGFAVLAKPSSTKPGVTVTAIVTPALAICIAALKAREGGGL